MCVSDSLDGDPPPRKHSREIDSLRRERDSIKRILSQANLDELSNELEKLNDSLTKIEIDFAGH